METKKQDSLTFVGPCRSSFARLATPQPSLRDGSPEFGLTLLFPKEDNGFCPNAQKSIDAARAGIKECATEMIPKGKPYGIPLMDGDKNGKHPGFWYMRAKSKRKVPVIGPDTVTVIPGEEWDSGDWCKAAVHFHATEYQGTWNIGCYLRSVQFVMHDEHFAGGGGSGVERFEPVEGYSAPAGDSGEGEFDPFE